MINIEMNYMKDMVTLNYGLNVKSLTPVEYGADSNAERFKLLDEKDNAYFVKVSREVSGKNLMLLSYLSKALGGYIITPIENHNAELYTKCEDYFIVVFPFIEGKNGFEETLTSIDMKTIGKIIKDLHLIDAAYLEDKFAIRRYSHNPVFRCRVRDMLKTLRHTKTEDSLILELRDFINSVKAQLDDILYILDNLSDSIVDKDNILSLCHTDIHAGNILKTSDSKLYIVDWDQAAIGPKELDLLFFGGGIAIPVNDENEVRSFYSGYGDCSIDCKKLAFYRFARIIEDIALFYQDIMDETVDYEKRKQALIYLKSNFNHNETIDCAYRALKYVK
jgi:spectinomycin phosphotransferase